MGATDWLLLDRVCALVRERSLRRLTIIVGCRSQHKRHLAPSATEAVPVELYERLRQQRASHTLSLRPLSSAGTAQMVAYLVNGRWGVNSTLVHERTGGSTFYRFFFGVNLAQVMLFFSFAQAAHFSFSGFFLHFKMLAYMTRRLEILCHYPHRIWARTHRRALL